MLTDSPSTALKAPNKPTLYAGESGASIGPLNPASLHITFSAYIMYH